MRLLFGPVRSRRLGLSLGLELVPKKICSMDCLYCEVGRTTLLTFERKAYLSWEEIEKALFEAKTRETEFDVFTLTGSGEPTLNIYFERTVEVAKNILSKPISVLTNSSTVIQSSIRNSLSKVDLVLASLDTALEKSFYLLNRPVRGINLQEIIEGLKALREEMQGELWLEVLLAKGINDKPEDLEALREAINYIKPHKTQLNTVVRPPAYPIVQPVSSEELEKIKNFLGTGVEIITPKDFEKNFNIAEKRLSKAIEGEEIEILLLDYLERRPAPYSELSSLFYFKKNLHELLEKMVKDGKIRKVMHRGEIFYSP